uniref:Uncharacterized protein n=1 Tax=Pithovirus LCPAC304 TaxID=2506594 RepID=A0A481Z8J8_9VIRU|nr:MAG: hypothetical protein LCPAC304_05510 [Pithovirus LCPAC304]
MSTVTVYENVSTTGKNSLLMDEKVTGAATSTFTANSYISMVTTNTGGRVVRQSKPYIEYEVGKSKKTLCTGVFNTAGGSVGVQSRIGLFDDVADQVTNPQGGDGFFYELDGTTMYIVKRTSSSGSQVDTRIAQSNWNNDRFDGTGRSRITITTWEDTFMLVFDQHSWNVGQVWIGLLTNGTIQYAHIFEGMGSERPYTRTAKLPIRYEIQNTSAGATSDEMRMMYQSVLTGAELFPIFPQLNFASQKVVTGGSALPVVSLRLKSAFNRLTLRIVDVTLFSNVTGASACIGIYLNPSLTAATFVSAGTDSAAEVDTSATAVNGGTLLASGFVTEQGVINISTSAGGNRSPCFDINADIAGTSDILSLVATLITGSPDVHASISWLEIS